MESGADLVRCYNPHANRLILAPFAEHEREQISQRTKAALAAAKTIAGIRLQVLKLAVSTLVVQNNVLYQHQNKYERKCSALESAKLAGRTIPISADKEFAIMVLQKPRAKLVWVRVGNCRRAYLLNLFRQHR